MARWRPWVVISAVTWQRYCANKNGSEKPVSNCWRRVDLPGRVVHRASQGGWSKRLSLMHMGRHPRVGGLAGLGLLRPYPRVGPPKGDAEHEHPRQGGTSTVMLLFSEGKLRRSTLQHVQRLCAPQRQLRRRFLPPEDAPPTMTRRVGAFLCNSLFQIGAGSECVFDHPREGMQAFESV